MHEPTDPAPQIRTDPLTGRRVIVAPERAARPSDLNRPYATAACPFCPGHEGETPHEVLAVPGPDRPGWSVRVGPNKFPALRGALDPLPAPGDDYLPGLGAHEVIIEGPAHVRCLTDLGAAQTARALAVYRDRLRAQRADPRLAYGQLFKNVG